MAYSLSENEIKRLDSCIDILNKVWRDLLEWEQLGTNTRKWHKENGRDPNRQPYCPSELGIQRTELLRDQLSIEVIEPLRVLKTNIEISQNQIKKG